MLAAEGLVELLPQPRRGRRVAERGRRARHLRGDGRPRRRSRASSPRSASRRTSSPRSGRMHFEMLAAYTRRDLLGLLPRSTRSIHSAINAAAQEPGARRRPTAQVNARLQALRFRSNQDGEKWKRAVKEHEQMIEALAARDAAAHARGPALRTCSNKRDAVLELLRDGAAAPEPPSERARCRSKSTRENAARAYDRVAGAQQRSRRPPRAAPAPRRRRARCCSTPAARPLRHRCLDLPGDAGRRVRAAQRATTSRVALDIARELKVPVAAARRRHQPVRPDRRRGAGHRHSKHLRQRARRRRGSAHRRRSSRASCSTT